MGDPQGFLKVKRKKFRYRPVSERVSDYKEIPVPHTKRESMDQASRCMDCGTPFCHWGCPVGNYIPEWNDLMFKNDWKRAYELLAAINNLPEVTGRICPALCEYSCVLGINEDPVTIRENELSIIEAAFRMGYVKPRPPKKRTGKKIAVVGSGPAGISAADQLNKAGHSVTVFEKDEDVGGILRLGIPDFKLEKWVLDRRKKILEKEGIRFKVDINVGVDYPAGRLIKDFDAVCLAGGSRCPRDLEIEGRNLDGIYFAMDYLCQSNRRAKKRRSFLREAVDAKDKKVVVIGGGDTGADCVGTAHRQGAAYVTQIEILNKPPESRTDDCPWPKYPTLLKIATSHEEGGERMWSVRAKRFLGHGGRVTKILCSGINAKDKEFEIEADLVILAIGFLHPEHEGLLDDLKLKLDKRGNVETGSGLMTSKKGVFCAGDMHRGQSLVVWAISEGRKAAHHIDKYLMGKTCLPAI